MLKFSVKSNIEEVRRSLAGLEKQVNKAARQALNRVAATAKSRAVKTIASETGLQQKLIRDRIAIYKASRFALTAIIEANPAAPNLARFGARQTKHGVSASAWRKRKIYKGTFLGNQGRTVFKRVGKARLPIKPVYGPSVPRTFLQRATREALTQTIRERFPIEFAAALKNQLRRAGFRP